MIRLDTVNFTLFELAPVPYEVYMKTYGCSNTLQVFMTANVSNMLVIITDICTNFLTILSPKL